MITLSNYFTVIRCNSGKREKATPEMTSGRTALFSKTQKALIKAFQNKEKTADFCQNLLPYLKKKSY
jgi:hypothetical protein